MHRRAFLGTLAGGLLAAPLGYLEGQTLKLEFRFAEGTPKGLCPE
jgi:hypothetical protein